MRSLLTVFAVVGLVLAASGAAEAAISFSGQSAEGNPPLSGTISFDSTNMYLTATVSEAGVAVDEDYLAVAVDVDNNDRWTAEQDAILVYDTYNNDGASWRVVASPLDYDPADSMYVWDCPWSDPKIYPTDAEWPTGMQITMMVDGSDLVYSATVPFSAMGVSAGDTIGVLVQTRDKNVSLYGGNGRVINYWPDSTCFNKLYDPAQFEDVVVPEPATMALMALGGIGMLVSRKRSK